MAAVLLIPVLIGFLVVLFTTPLWIKRAKKVGLTGKDLHKLTEDSVPESGGIIVLLGFILGILLYIQIITFYFKSTENLIEIFSLISSILIVGFIGFIDDIFGWKIGLNKRTRIIFLIFAAVPLIVINVGESRMMGIEFGLLYPLFFVPIGIIGASATFNFIAGFNGVETSQGAILLLGLSLITFLTGNSWLSIITLIMVACLIAFYLFNKHPARVFPGDSLTYPVGALIAIIAILGNIEKIAVFFFIPYIIETGLKVRGKLKKESFAKLEKDGSLRVPYDKFYGLEHIAVALLKKFKYNGKVYEKEVVWVINSFQVLIILIGLLIFREGIFL